MVKYYAGIGARETPTEVCSIMNQIAIWLAEECWILRSGGADGADRAFEYGCDLVGGCKEIFLPQKKYNNNLSDLISPPEAAFDLIDDMWEDLRDRTPLVRALFARNCQQVLGVNLNSPSSVIICYTRNGQDIGGTGRAIQLAKRFNIPVFNLFNESKFTFFKEKNHFLKKLNTILENG